MLTDRRANERTDGFVDQPRDLRIDPLTGMQGHIYKSFMELRMIQTKREDMQKRGEKRKKKQSKITLPIVSCGITTICSFSCSLTIICSFSSLI